MQRKGSIGRVRGAGLALWLIAGSCLAAAPKTLTLPARLDDRLDAGQHAIYRVGVPVGKAVDFTLLQRDITLQLRATNDAGAALPLMQDDAGRQSRLRLTLIADRPTVWTLDIAAGDAKKPANFRLTGGKPHATGATDRAHAAAEQALAEAENLRRGSGSLEHGKKSSAADPAMVLARYQAAFDIAQKAGDACIQLLADAGRARYEFALGRYADAARSADIALHYRCGSTSDASAAAEEAVARRTLSSARGYLGDFTSAIPEQERALALYRQTGDAGYQAMALGNLSIDYRVTGAMHHALDAARAALKLAGETGNSNRAEFARESIAAIELQQGEWGESREDYLKTLAALRESPYPLIEGMTWNDLGQLYAQIHEYGESAHAFSQAEGAWTRAGNQDGLAETKLDEGDLALDQGRIDAASALFRNDLDYDIAHGLQREQAHALIGLGLAATARRDWTGARKHLSDARDLAHKVGSTALETWAIQALGDLDSQQHRTQDAQQDYAHAYTIALRANDYNSQVVILGDRARLALASGDAEAARKLIVPAIGLIENEQAAINAPSLRTHYFASLRAYYGLCIDVLMRLDQEHPGKGHDVAALRVSEQARARALRDRLLERYVAIKQNAAPQLITAEQSAEDALHQAAWRRAQLPVDAMAPAQQQAQQDIDQASRRLDDARGALRAADPRYAELAHPAPIDLVAVRHDLLDDDAVVLEYWLGDSRSYVWRITRNSVDSRVLPSRATLEKSADALRAAVLEPAVPTTSTSFDARVKVDAGAAASVRRQSLALGRTLLRTSAADDDGTRVVIADGELQRIPFNLLDPAPRHTWVYLPSLATLHELRAAPSTANATSIAVFADPVFSDSDPRLAGRAVSAQSDALAASQVRSASADVGIDALQRLPYSDVEAAGIAALVPAPDRWIATGFAASRASALAADWSRYSLVHFATHALIDMRHPELSGIVLSLYDAEGRREDGILRMEDIYNLRMPADLVTLSVCDSSREPSRGAEGIFGLSRAFFYAGVRRLLVSLWPVDDRASAQLMSLFYRDLLEKHDAPQVALQTAQAAMRRDPRWRSPYYWAGFVVQGDWR